MSSPTGSDGPGGRTQPLVVLAGPTAVGKGTVVAEIQRLHPEVWVSLSVTTRPARPGERNGVDYLFVDDAEFDRMVAAGELLEWAELHGSHRSGTPRRPVDEVLAAGGKALLEIDVQGARQIRAVRPDALLVFLAPPSWDELVRRLVGRGTESDAQRERRLSTARAELAAAAEFDLTIVNAEVRQAAEDLVALWASAPDRAAGHQADQGPRSEADQHPDPSEA